MNQLLIQQLEVKEETGLTIKNLKICGIKQWFKDGIRNVCFLFKTKDYEGELVSNQEGTNSWIKLDEIQNMKLAKNFDIMLKVFLSDKYNEHFHIKEDDVVKDILK